MMNDNSINIKYMQQAIELSKKGIGFVNPNPVVGAVIVKDNKIIGQGYHEFFGGPHAEINAINNSTENVKNATIYVTLEPCSYYGKTPPCVDAIIKNGISKVVIGMQDPNPLVAGKGIEKLKNNKIEVETGILENEIKILNEIFIKYITKKLPFCILKTAMTFDGKIATVSGDSKWISNEKSRKYVHELRQKCSGIMVGVNTVINDNPSLTVRIKGEKTNNPVRIIVDTHCRIPLNAKVLNSCLDTKTIIATTEQANIDTLKSITKTGTEIIKTPLKNGKVDLKYLMKILGEKGIDSILIEGGSTLNYSAINDGIVDKVISFISPKIIGGESAKTPVGGEGKKFLKDAFILKNLRIKYFDDDIMIEAYIKKAK
ncbi:MAG: bifunctional diaminohydroxyphosphoribosylaminopyrimidine deaminase/5-amino-6-(5-phosphoribosylamino)uracil reductase RibD [Bacteroidales bacterium]|nr:bifunctional diaminohydroxyphosphoribosylaminopyrimidine deaminase/5-amino-6-(5-phosphoribosylamino)uracil reductase RibD [Bacteroidales bacterium]